MTILDKTLTCWLCHISRSQVLGVGSNPEGDGRSHNTAQKKIKQTSHTSMSHSGGEKKLWYSVYNLIDHKSLCRWVCAGRRSLVRVWSGQAGRRRSSESLPRAGNPHITQVISQLWAEPLLNQNKQRSVVQQMSRDEEDPQARFRKEQDRDFHVCVCVRVCVRLHAHCCPLSLLPDVKECAMWQAHPLWQQLQQSQPVDQTEVAEVTKHTLSYTGDGRTSARTHSTEYICKRKWHTHRNVCRGIQHRWSNTQRSLYTQRQHLPVLLDEVPPFSPSSLLLSIFPPECHPLIPLSLFLFFDSLSSCLPPSLPLSILTSLFCPSFIPPCL